MKIETVSSAQANLYRLVDQVLETGEPVIIKRHGRSVQLVAEAVNGKLAQVRKIPDLVTGNSDNLPDQHWDKEWQPFI